MSMIGKKVQHTKFGTGTIESIDESYVEVRFNEGIKRFSVSSLGTFLVPAEVSIKDEFVKITAQIQAEEKKKAEEREQNHIRQMVASQMRHTAQKTRSVEVDTYTTTVSFFDDMSSEVNRELYFLKNGGGKHYRLIDGQRVEELHGQYIYSFESDSELFFPDGTDVTVWQGSSSVPAIVVVCEEFTIILNTESALVGDLSLVEISAEPWQLLSALTDRMKEIREHPSPIVNSLIKDGPSSITRSQPIFKGQDVAVNMALSQPITFIWGPPGTGKTETLARIAMEHIKQNHSVLMISHSNVSVDGAILRLANKLKTTSPGMILRYGYPRDKALLESPTLTSFNLAISRNPALMEERKRLTNERTKVSRYSARYTEISRRLTAIRKLLQDEEKSLMYQASFVATTISKVTVDKALYERKFDVVIFDEASMAFIPQIIVAAHLAKSHFVCMGDFRQLPPIAQGSDDSKLHADIFQYCGITAAVENGWCHKWMCLLDTQYRMHPHIADYVSQFMYNGLLVSGTDQQVKCQPIVDKGPIPGMPIGIVNLSGMMTVCSKTKDNSRINVLSALMTMRLAIEAAKNNDVGIITPYNAQSRLIHAMAKDAMQNDPTLHKITCATVHQFQGSEQPVIFFDAVDCYRQAFPGVPLTSTKNNYANRLFNVAMTRAKGKFIAVGNLDYLRDRNVNSKLLLGSLISTYSQSSSSLSGAKVCMPVSGNTYQSFDERKYLDEFIRDIQNVREEIRIDISGPLAAKQEDCQRIANAIQRLPGKVKVCIRATDKASVPECLRKWTIENKYLLNAISIIDRSVAWFGAPASAECFRVDGTSIPTRYRPIIRYAGTNAAKSLYGFLEMSSTVDQAMPDNVGEADSFASYVAAKKKCPSCGAPLVLKKGKKFYLACSARCGHTEFVEPDLVEDYLYDKSHPPIYCPKCNTSLQAKVGQYGIYVCCYGVTRHYVKLDEI